MRSKVLSNLGSGEETQPYIIYSKYPPIIDQASDYGISPIKQDVPRPNTKFDHNILIGPPGILTKSHTNRFMNPKVQLMEAQF